MATTTATVHYTSFGPYAQRFYPLADRGGFVPVHAGAEHSYFDYGGKPMSPAQWHLHVLECLHLVQEANTAWAEAFL